MGLIAPFGLALLALLAPVIAMYLLKRRRDEVPVSSTFLWERVVQDMEANAPWQKLRRNLLLLLQLLALLCLIFAVARPFLRTAGAVGQNLVVVLDTSASMGATDGPGGETRLEAAREEVLRLLDGLPLDGRMTLIRGGGGAEVLAASTRDRALVADALAALAPTSADSDMSAAISLAAATAARQSASEVVLLSDGAITAPGAPRLEEPLRYLPIGREGNNQAITALNLQPQGLSYTLFVQVTNYQQSTVTRRLRIDTEGSDYATAFDLQLGPGERTERVIEGLPPELTSVVASLDGSDLLGADDSAWAVPPLLGTRDVRLVTPGNVFLRQGLGLLPDLDLTVAAPGTTVTETVASPVVAVLDRTLSDTLSLAPEGESALLLIAPPAPNAALGISMTGTISQPVPLPANANDPLLAFVDLSDVAILRAQRMALPPWARPVIVDGRTGAPLLWVGEREGRRIAALAFDLHESDLVLRVAFPLLLANLIGELTTGPGGSLPDQAIPGQALTLSLPPQATGAVVLRPDGQRQRLAGESGSAIFTTDLPGLYEVSWEGGAALPPPTRFAVNLFSPQESNLAPATQLTLGGGSNAGGDGGQPNTVALAGEGRSELWRPLALGALLILSLEWLVYQRDAVARLRQRLFGRATGAPRP